MTNLDEYWNKFLAETGRDSDDKCAGDLTFDATGLVGEELISLILGGKKTAFFSSFATYQIENEPLPISGELYLVLDNNNNPRCVIEIDNVSVLPYNAITWDMARREGEDENLEQWRLKKQEQLEEEGDILGFDFYPELKVVFQMFHVVYR